MASAVLLNLTKRAAMAEDLLVKVKSQLEAVKRAAGLNLMKEEQNRLVRENELLRNEVGDCKKQLILAETSNGIRQVSLPTKRTLSPAQSSGQTEKKKNKEGEAHTAEEKETSKKGEIKEKVKVRKSNPQKVAVQNDPDDVDVSKLDLRVGLIVSAQKHPDADKQYVEEVDIGDAEDDGKKKLRTVVSGLVNYMPVEAIQNRLGIFLCNLKPAKIRGVMSEAMLVCACTPDVVELLDPPPGCVPGDRVTCAQFLGKPEALLNPKKKIWETLKPALKTNNKCLATFKGEVLVVEGKGEVKALSLADAQLS